MERFRTIERKVKFKAFSDRALEASDKLDPVQHEYETIKRWLSNSINTLSSQVENMECEIESVQVSDKKKKKDWKKQAKVDNLKEHVKRHQWHIQQLETVMRMLDNESVKVDQVKKIQNDVDFYIDYYQDEDYYEDKHLYADLDVEGFRAKNEVDSSVFAVAAAIVKKAANDNCLASKPCGVASRNSGTLKNSLKSHSRTLSSGSLSSSKSTGVHASGRSSRMNISNFSEPSSSSPVVSNRKPMTSFTSKPNTNHFPIQHRMPKQSIQNSFSNKPILQQPNDVSAPVENRFDMNELNKALPGGIMANPPSVLNPENERPNNSVSYWPPDSNIFARNEEPKLSAFVDLDYNAPQFMLSQTSTCKSLFENSYDQNEPSIALPFINPLGGNMVRDQSVLNFSTPRTNPLSRHQERLNLFADQVRHQKEAHDFMSLLVERQQALQENTVASDYLGPETYTRFSDDVLFFIFYYLEVCEWFGNVVIYSEFIFQGFQSQRFAGRLLKIRSWFFHMKRKLWFKAIDTPRILSSLSEVVSLFVPSSWSHSYLFSIFRETIFISIKKNGV